MDSVSESDKHAHFTEIYERYVDAIFRFCLIKVRDRELATDITQETFIKAWNYTQQDKEIENMRALLYRIAYNAIIDWSRKKKASSLDSLIEAGKSFDSPELDGSRIEQRQNALLTAKLLEQLDPKYADIMTLHYIEGLNPRDIAEITGERANTISVRLHRGIKQLQDLYAEITTAK